MRRLSESETFISFQLQQGQQNNKDTKLLAERKIDSKVIEQETNRNCATEKPKNIIVVTWVNHVQIAGLFESKILK